jgi:hypothetical protein
MTNDEPQIPEEHAEDRCDWLLEDLVKLANCGFSVSATLMVGGTLLSGQLLGGKGYFEEFTALLESAQSGQESKVAETQAVLADQFRKTAEKAYDPDHPSASHPQYLHIRAAEILGSAGSVAFGTDTPTILRIRLSRIDGFILGRVGKH